LDQTLHIFAFLKKHPKLTLYMSPEPSRIDYGDFQTNKEDFSEIYRDAEEFLPHRMPVPRGRGITMTAFVDASHVAGQQSNKKIAYWICCIPQSRSCHVVQQATEYGRNKYVFI
jgi:hypothetical protein